MPNNNAISSGDPQALKKLTAKLEGRTVREHQPKPPAKDTGAR